jgi:hypothetical protein
MHLTVFWSQTPPKVTHYREGSSSSIHEETQKARMHAFINS